MNVLSSIVSIYITLMSVIFAGVMNMVFTKNSLYRRNNRPIDNGRILSDGRRLFGDNKTVNGFIGMTVSGGLAQMILGAVCSFVPSMERCNRLYEAFPNTLAVNLFTGLFFGFAYALFELPNSFIKRRIGIHDGKTGSGAVGVLFFIIDQIDSLIGVALCLSVLCRISVWEYFGCLLVGAFTHIAVNLILYKLRIRRNI
ncbi:MAG: CDP-archaeol synthase [Ruminococcus sp.]|nr:CDP-archaeol synthase [Ruminococcus sp.]